MADKRVIDLTEKSTVDNSDYLIVDNATGGTKKLQLGTLIGSLDGIKKAVVQTLPTQDIDTNTIYLVPKQTAGTQNVYDEYMYINNAWELIGDTEVNLSEYEKKPVLVKTIVADGVKTHSEILDEFSAEIMDIPTSEYLYFKDSYLVYDKSVYKFQSFASNGAGKVANMQFGRVYSSSIGNIGIQTIKISSDSYKISATINSDGTVSFADQGSSIPPSGNPYELYLKRATT